VTFDLAIFDCDGVLVDTERLTVAVEARILTELGWPHTTEDVVARFMGRTHEAQLDELRERLGAEKTRIFEQLSSAEIDAAFARELVPVAGVETLLDRLEAHDLATCVASSGSHAKMRRTLGQTGLYARFEGRIFSAGEVAHGKPEPDLFLHAAARMDADPGRCVVIEDSVYGVRAAVSAGMTAYGFAGGLTPADDLAAAGADTVFHDMAELAGLVGHSPSGTG
jgi:HAD superfamily hydrolase (TIGR01509 family)